MRIPPRLGFYGVLSEPSVGYERLAREMVDRSVRIIQLRMKGAPRREVARVASAVRGIVPPGVCLIVNDDPEIAAEVGADGVHLGRGDPPYAEAREMLGPDAVIGLSTHDPSETRAACALGPDYVGLGPVFATRTKENPDPVIGLDGLRELLAAATVPAVAIGGIDHGNVGLVLEAGAENVCSIGCICGSDDPGADLDRMLRAIEGRRGG